MPRWVDHPVGTCAPRGGVHTAGRGGRREREEKGRAEEERGGNRTKASKAPKRMESLGES